MYFNRLTPFFIFCTLAFSCSGPDEVDSENNETTDEQTHVDIIEDTLSEPQDTISMLSADVYSAKAIYSEDIGWGYQILLNDQAYINQPHIPAISGMKGFDSEEDALKTAHLGIYKIENGMFPPTITEEELDSLGVIN